MKYKGKIQILGYSNNNNIAKFQLYVYKPIKRVIAFGEYNFDLELTRIKKVLKWELDSWLDVCKEILSSSDWDINIEVFGKRR